MMLTRRDLGRMTVAAAGTAMLPGLARAAGHGTEVSHGLSAFGDLKYPAGFTHFEYANPDAPKGGLWSTAYGNVTFDSFNPWVLKGNAAIGMSGLMWDSLMVGAGDEADAMYGLIAESVELPDDRAWVAFNMRPEARHHDGTPITAEDVVFTIAILREKGHPTYRALLAPITDVIAEDTLRVRFDFAEDAAKRDLPMLVAGLSILSKSYYESIDFAEADLTVPVANGAYTIGRFEAGAWTIFERVEDYWAADLPVNKGRNNFDQIRFDYYRDRTASFEGFKSGQFTFYEEFWSKIWATSYTPEAFPEIATGEVVKESLPDNRPAGSQGFWLNLRRPIFQDARVREAIGMAFDFEWSNERLFYGLYKRTDSFFENGPMQAEGTPTPGELAVLERFADQLPPTVLTEPAVVPQVTDASGRARRALRTAAKMLDDAGWTVTDGVRMKDGETLRFEFLVGSQGFVRIITPFVKNLERIGVQAEIREVDPASYRDRVKNFDFDITTSRKSMGLTPGVELRQYFHSSSADQPGSSNTAGVADPVIDGLIDVIERAESREDLTSAVRALDRVLRSMHIWVPQWHKGSHSIAYWDMYDRPAVKPLYARGVADLWWVNPDKLAKLQANGRF